MRKLLALVIASLIALTACDNSSASQGKGAENTYITPAVTTTVKKFNDEGYYDPPPIKLIFPEPKNQLEAGINLMSELDPINISYPEIDCQNILFDFDGDNFPEFLCLEKRSTPCGEMTWCNIEVYNLTGSERKDIGSLQINIDNDNKAKITKYYDKEKDEYFYITDYSYELPERDCGSVIYKHIFYNDEIYRKEIAANHFYYKDGDWYLSTNKVNGKDLGGIGVKKSTLQNGKPYFFDEYQKYISQYEKIEEITFEVKNQNKISDLVKDYDTRFSKAPTRPPISIYDSGYIPKENGIEDYYGMVKIQPEKFSLKDNEIYEDYIDTVIFDVDVEQPDFSALKAFPNVSKLSFWNRENKEILPIDVSSLNNYPQIKEISISRYTDLKSVSKLKYIETVDIYGEDIDNLDFLSNMQSLRIIKISGDASQIYDFYKPIYKLKNLKVIDHFQVAGQWGITEYQEEKLRENFPDLIIVNTAPQS